MDAVRLRTEIQSYVEGRGIPIGRFAKEAGVPAPTLQHMMATDWKPSFAILQACIAAVRKDAPPQNDLFTPTELHLPSALIERPSNKCFAVCLEAWRSNSGVSCSSILNAVDQSGLGARVSMVEVGDDNRLWLRKFGPTAFGEAPTNRRLTDVPDRRFGNWIEQRIWPMITTGEPVFASCEIKLNTVIGSFDIPYTTLRLPMRSKGGMLYFDQAITITRLEESPYKSAVELGSSGGF